MGTDIPAAEIAAAASLVVALLSGVVSYAVAKRATLLEDRSVAAARKLMKYDNRRYKTFDYLKRRLGGFDDQELRKILVRAGAIRFYLTWSEVYTPGEMADLVPNKIKDEPVEVWSLLPRGGIFVFLDQPNLAVQEMKSSTIFPIEFKTRGTIAQIGGDER